MSGCSLRRSVQSAKLKQSHHRSDPYLPQKQQSILQRAQLNFSHQWSVSDIRLKKDIELVSRSQNGHNLYRYRYIWSDQVYVGVMAQEVQVSMPEAVIKGQDGFLRVYYDKLGLKLQTLEEWEKHGQAMH